MPDPSPLYPLLFDPIYKEKVWGGRSLERLGRTLPGDGTTPIGESWELADLASTSASGGGGGAEHSVVSSGPLAGKTIRELMVAHGEALLGRGVQPAADGGFPLLIKFLDAKENLSVQVHPSREYAAAHPDAHLKSEAWYIVFCAPGAVIYKGLKPGVTPEQLRTAIETNTDEAVVPLLNAVPVKPGDCHYLPSGTLHALGAGVLVAEVQTPSDTTFRVYDWGRTDRELHVEQAMACIDFEQHRDAQSFCERGQLYTFDIQTKAKCDYFRIDEVSCTSRGVCKLMGDGGVLWIGIKGDLVLEHGRDDRDPFVHQGQTALLPMGMRGSHLVSEGPGKWLRVALPRV